MEEVSNNGAVIEETLSQTETAAPQAESNQETGSEASESQNKSSPDQQDKSWIKKVRRDRDEAVRKAQEAERKAQLQEELIRQLMANQAMAKDSPPAEDILQKVQSQEYVAGEDVAKALKAQKEEFRKELDELKKIANQTVAKNQFADLKREFSDFDDVVNPETLELLKETDPSTYQSIDEIKDSSKAYRLAYKMIKAQGLVDKIPDERRAKEVEKRLEQNKKTVQSPTSFEKRPMVQAFKQPESKKDKEALWAETLKYASMGGGGY